jgi:hypothetical protein
MSRLVFTLVVLSAVGAQSSLCAQQKRTINWADWKGRQLLKHGEVLPPDGDQPERLRIEKTASGAESIPLFEIDQPQIQGRVYVLKGRVRYTDVAAGNAPTDAGFLELWSHFPDGGAYFTRTLGENGPMAKLIGTSAWREIALPFDKADAPSPVKLVVNLHLPGPGAVELSQMELLEDVPSGAARAAGAWWDDRTGGLIGGLGGTILGLLGAAIGIAVGVFRQRTLGHIISTMILVVSLAALAAGVAAATQAQPYAVYFPLLLLGGIGAVCAIVSLVVIRIGLQQDELRRMQALDMK